MTVWKAEIPKKDYNVNLPYVPQIFGKVRQQITEILEHELDARGQTKSAITVLATYEAPVELDANGSHTFQVHHRGEMRVLLLKNDIDNHITKTIGEIEYRIYELLQKKSKYETL
ncbi:hypothetical protein RhiirA4_467747 [Rhizophagus irregularis]|uniref:Uncharacterized protein n=1 Tax=Rhizophagus irregularis TaxID=588596 RepID=A0A2I1GWG1_9GLOM|nr:hypothetical protein RhiirA4_467747 [Rhizophagus irregularis]